MRIGSWIVCVGGLAVAACGSSGGSNGGAGAGQGTGAGAGQGTGAGPATGGFGGGDLYGELHAGDYHLGPVDFAETVWTNSCGPYAPEIQALEGVYLAGVDLAWNGDGSLCDACALVTTRLGRTAVVRIVTTGVSNAEGDMDVSPETHDGIYELDPLGTPEHPRPMTWQLARCPDTGTLRYQWQTGANEWWTSFWLRNARVPLVSVEVRSANHADWFALRREVDGTLNDDGGFGAGAFELRITGLDGQQLVDSFPGFTPGSVVASTQQFP
ncbi:MAG: hypothetical protein HY908_23315 [Myxococcales bacterium]|nr:hypothetical protein [Myxococcales bacterium]